jgi:hypothetical protein
MRAVAGGGVRSGFPPIRIPLVKAIAGSDLRSEESLDEGDFMRHNKRRNVR